MFKNLIRIGRCMPGLASVYVWAVVASLFFPFFMLSSINSEVTLGYTRNLQIPSIDPSVKTREFMESMCLEADKNNIAVARRTRNASDPMHGIVLEFCGADVSVREWEQTGYPSYTPEDRVDIKALDPVAVTEARGLYNLYGGTEQQRAQLIMTLREHGARVVEYDVLGFRSVLGYYIGTPSGYAFVATCLALTVALIGAVLRQTKKSARLRLHGASHNQVYRTQLVDSGPFFVAGSIALYGLFYVFLAFYNSWAFVALTLKTQLILLSWMLCLMLLLHYAACMFTTALPIGQALKGKLPTRITYMASWSCRALALVLITTILMMLAHATQQLYALNASRAAVLQGNGYTVSFNGFRYEKSDEQNLQQWVRKQVEFDNVILANAENPIYTSIDSLRSPQNGGDDTDSMEPTQGLGRTFLYVNRAYAESNPSSLPEGLPSVEELETRTGISIYYPRELENQSEDVKRLAAVTLDQAYNLTSTNTSEDSTAMHSEFRAYDSMTRSYTYGDRIIANYFVQNPVIIYVPKHVLIESSEMLTGAFSQSGAFVKERQQALDSLEGTTARGYVGEILPVSDRYFGLLTKMQSEQRISIYALFVLSILGVVTLLEYARVYCVEHQQRIARSFTYGMHPAETFRGVLIGELILTILVFFYGIFQLTAMSREQYLTAGGEISNAMTVLAAGLFALTLLVSSGMSLLAFTYTYRSTVSRHARKEMY